MVSYFHANFGYMRNIYSLNMSSIDDLDLFFLHQFLKGNLMIASNIFIH
jgi:hypothetical protein